MAKSNTEVVIEAFAANASGDEDALRALFDPEIEVYAEPGVVNAGRYVGWEGWLKWLRQWNDAWDEISYEPLGKCARLHTYLSKEGALEAAAELAGTDS